MEACDTFRKLNRVGGRQMQQPQAGELLGQRDRQGDHGPQGSERRGKAARRTARGKKCAQDIGIAEMRLQLGVIDPTGNDKLFPPTALYALIIDFPQQRCVFIPSNPADPRECPGLVQPVEGRKKEIVVEVRIDESGSGDTQRFTAGRRPDRRFGVGNNRVFEPPADPAVASQTIDT